MLKPLMQCKFHSPLKSNEKVLDFRFCTLIASFERKNPDRPEKQQRETKRKSKRNIYVRCD